MNKLYRDYRDRAAFHIVYIQEAHPIDGWQMDVNVKDGVLVAATNNSAERADVAGLCVTKLGIELPALIDSSDDGVERAYTGWPDRLYVVDRNGRVAYKSAAGPFGFKPSELEAALNQVLASDAAPRSETR